MKLFEFFQMRYHNGMHGQYYNGGDWYSLSLKEVTSVSKRSKGFNLIPFDTFITWEDKRRQYLSDELGHKSNETLVQR